MARRERFEVWLVDFVTGWTNADTLLWFDDAFAGNVLALGYTANDSVCQLLVDRSRANPLIVLVVESGLALAALSGAIASHRRRLRGRDDDRRRFFELFERMSDHLLATALDRAREFPADALTRLRRLTLATPMVGVEARLHDDAGAVRTPPPSPASAYRSPPPGHATPDRRYPTRFAACVATSRGRRAALWNAAAAAFQPLGSADRELGRLVAATGLPAERYALQLSPQAAPSEAWALPDDAVPLPASRTWLASDPCGGLDCVSPFDCDVIPDLSDCHLPGCHLPDIPNCDVIDVPCVDCSP